MKSNYETVRREMPEGAVMTKVVTYLMVIALAVLLSWMSERDEHPFNEPVNMVQS